MAEREFAWRSPLTEVAGEAFTIMHTFNLALGKPFPGYQAELAAPPGPSTGGGAQSLQHITLINPEGQRFALGSVDTAMKEVTLRSHPMIDSMHRARFGCPFPVPASDYQDYIGKVSRLFSGASMAVTVETVVAPEARGRARSATAAWLLLVLLVVVSAAGAALLALR